MSFKFINIDLSLLTLNVTSIVALILNFITEHLHGIGGFLVMASVAYLNYIKAQRIKKSPYIDNAKDDSKDI